MTDEVLKRDKGNGMKLFFLVFIALLSVPTSYASEKIDKIIDVLKFEDSFKSAIQDIRPLSVGVDKLDNGNEVSVMSNRHYQEDLELYEKYISWKNIRSEVVLSIEKTYTKDEIEAFYQFITTDHGASFFKKFEMIGQSIADLFSISYESYAREQSALHERHRNEIVALSVKLEDESEKRGSVPDDPPKEATIGDIARFGVATDNGEMVGYMVRPGRKPALFDKSPFEEGDLVLSINGILVNEPSKVREVYEMLKTFKQVHFEVQRSGEFVDFVIDISELGSSDGEDGH